MSEATITTISEDQTDGVMAKDLAVRDVLVIEQDGVTSFAVVTDTLAGETKTVVAVTTDSGEQTRWQWDNEAVVIIRKRDEVAAANGDADADADADTDTQDHEQTPAEAVAEAPKIPAEPFAKRPDLSQCDGKSEKQNRRCKLVANHEGPHRFVIREEVPQAPTLAQLRESADPKVKKTFAGFSLTMEPIPASADLSKQYSREVERDADQKKVDADAKKTYDKWVKGGSKKGTFVELAPKFGSRYIVPPAAFDTVINMLRKAVLVGAPTSGKKMAYRRAAHESGNVIINWLITDADAVLKDPKKNGGE